MAPVKTHSPALTKRKAGGCAVLDRAAKLIE
jgi:hypothetical protein